MCRRIHVGVNIKRELAREGDSFSIDYNNCFASSKQPSALKNRNRRVAQRVDIRTDTWNISAPCSTRIQHEMSREH